MPRLVFPDTYCYVEGQPKWDWERAQRRHYPDIHNHSNVSFLPPPPPTKVLMIDSTYRNQKRHYCIHVAKSYLDDYM